MSAWRRYRSRPGASAGTLAALLLVAVGAGADLLASDQPIAVRVDGATWLLPCLGHPAPLRSEDQQTLRARSEWMIPTLVPHGPLGDLHDAAPLAPPSRQHLLGTDGAGRDVLARLLHGTRTALVVGGLATVLFVLAGLLVGSACAADRRVDLALARVIEVGGAVPAWFLLLAVQAAALLGGGPSLLEVAVAIALTRWPEVARVTRAEALRVAVSGHVEAARALGVAPWSIALRHVLPLAAGPALVAGAIGVGQAVLLEAGLSFLGFGVPPPVPSWGGLLADAHASGLPLRLLLPPTLLLAVLVLACGRVADGLQAALDPRSVRLPAKL